MRIFFSVGEPSGDLHGSNLISRLKERSPRIECVGFGGPRMQAAGCELDADLTQHAVMGFVRAVAKAGVMRRLLQQADESFRRRRPDAVVLIDYPGFNWWVASRARAHGIPVFYYGVPQMWAWARWRVRKMKRLVNHALCKLPFEETWFRERGCPATYVGHPYFDETRERKLDAGFLWKQRQDRRPLVTILPGSRVQEVKDNLPYFLRAAERVWIERWETRFAVAAYNDQLGAMARQACESCPAPVDVHVQRTAELIHLSHSCMACSGSVSLELLYHAKPSVVLYWVNPLVYWLARKLLIKVKYITLVNLLADDEPFVEHPVPYDPRRPGAEHVPFPEYPTFRDQSEDVAAHIIAWLANPQEHERRVAQLQGLKARYAIAGASSRAADYILDTLKAPATRAPRRLAA